MLTGCGWHTARPQPFSVQTYRQRDIPIAGNLGVVHQREHASGLYLRIIDHLIDRLNHRRRNRVRSGPSKELIRGESFGRVLDDRIELSPMRDPLRVRRESRVIANSVQLQRLTQAAKDRIVARCDHDVPIRGPERPVRSDRAQARPHRRRHTSRRHVPHHVIGNPGQRRIHERGLESRTAPAPVTLTQRCEDRDGGPHPGTEINHGATDSCRHTIWLSRHRDDARIRLHQRIVPGLIAHGAVLPVRAER